MARREGPIVIRPAGQRNRRSSTLRLAATMELFDTACHASKANDLALKVRGLVAVERPRQRPLSCGVRAAQLQRPHLGVLSRRHLGQRRFAAVSLRPSGFGPACFSAEDTWIRSRSRQRAVELGLRCRREGGAVVSNVETDDRSTCKLGAARRDEHYKRDASASASISFIFHIPVAFLASLVSGLPSIYARLQEHHHPRRTSRTPDLGRIIPINPSAAPFSR